VDIVKIDGTPVRIYSAEKTVADCFKYRNKIGLDVAVEALREYREKKKKPDYKALLKFARVNRVQKIMAPYMEALL
jgi:predicted transcriptional regulator of viral defense system